MLYNWISAFTSGLLKNEPYKVLGDIPKVFIYLIKVCVFTPLLPFSILEIYFKEITLDNDSKEEFKEKLGEALNILNHVSEDCYNDN